MGEFESSKDVEVIQSFDAMGLKDELLRGIYAFGFEKPSAIQQRAIVPILKGRDVIAQVSYREQWKSQPVGCLAQHCANWGYLVDDLDCH